MMLAEHNITELKDFDGLIHVLVDVKSESLVVTPYLLYATTLPLETLLRFHDNAVDGLQTVTS